MIRAADIERPVMRRDGSYAYTEREWDWSLAPHSMLPLLRATLGKVGDPVSYDKRVFGWEQGFKAAYERLAREHTAKALADLSRAALPADERLALAEGQE